MIKKLLINFNLLDHFEEKTKKKWKIVREQRNISDKKLKSLDIFVIFPSSRITRVCNSFEKQIDCSKVSRISI